MSNDQSQSSLRSTSLLAVLLLLVSLMGFAQQANADCSSQSDIPEAECSVLVSLYESAGGGNWNDNSNWLNDSPCTWFGVICGNDSVERLYLADNGLTGTVSSLSALSNMRFLNLNFNQLTGTLPDINGLSNLDGADFYSNEFNGPLPEFRDLPVLTYLNLGFNKFTGTISESLALLPSLRSLILDGNLMTGTIPADFSSSSVTGMILDSDAHCAASLELVDWLAELEGPITDVEFCWILSAEVGEKRLTAGDSLELFTRIDGQELTEAVTMDLYLSLLTPDGDTEAFLVLTENGVVPQLGSTNTTDWIPTLTNYTLEAGSDTTLLPVFAYVMNGTEPVGNYTFNIRATNPGTKEIINSTSASLYYNPSLTVMGIEAPEHAYVSNSVNFAVQTDSDIDGISYHWDFEDGSTATGKSVSHTFNEPDRYRVTLTAQLNGEELPDPTVHHINIGRSFDQTVYPLIGSSFSANESVTRNFSWNSCDEDWRVYHGKYFKLWLEASQDESIDRQVVSNGLLFADFLFDAYSELFGWDYLPSIPALDIYVCRAIPGGGTGTGGTFLNSAVFITDASDFISAQDYPAFVHEFIHAWDFRAGAWMNAPDGPHAFTGGLEPIISHWLGTGQGVSSWGGDLNVLGGFEGNFLFNHYLRTHLNRYLSRPELNWSTYYSDEFFSYGFAFEPIPEHKEAMLVQGGLLVSLYAMHGLEGLQSIFSAADNLMRNDPRISDLGVGFGSITQLEIAETFMRAVADGLQLDVSDYFAYWKWPIERLDAYMSRYPSSDKTLDKDGDGYSPLHRDLDDSDPTVYPYAPELVDGKDNNQDGLVDENTYLEGNQDFTTVATVLPALYKGSIDSLIDEDSFQFTLTEEAVVKIVMYSVDSNSTVPYSSDNDRPVSTFAGTVYLNGSYYSPLLHEAMSAPEAQSGITLSAGTHTITVSSNTLDDRNSNPGDYEIQVFINDYLHRLSVEELIAELY